MRMTGSLVGKYSFFTLQLESLQNPNPINMINNLLAMKNYY